MRCSSLLLLALAGILLAGCCATETLTIERPAPPPTVVTVTDTVRIATPAPPPTVEVVERLRVDTLVVTETQAVEVLVYPDGPSVRDSLPTLDVVGMAATDTILVIQTKRSTQRYRLPVDGETWEGQVLGSDSLAARIYGTPTDPPDEVVEVRCPEALIRRSLWGWLQLVLGLFAAFAFGWIVRSLVLATRP
ncbi:MAG: hypothetical protein AAGG50_03755 [Bacteroidota bacterium]